MMNRTWEVTIGGAEHRIEFRHSPITNKRSILVDGREIPLPKEQRRLQWDTGTHHQFHVADHECLVATRSSGFDFEPHLYVDGVNVDTGRPLSHDDPSKPTEQAVRTRRVGVVVIALIAGVACIWINARVVLSSGEYFPYLALLGPAALVLSGYYALFPDDPWVMPKPIPIRMIAMLLLAFALGIANWWATHNGLYSLLFPSG
jgi:hypothetical protein